LALHLRAQKARSAASDEERAKQELAEAERRLKDCEEAAKEAAEKASASKDASGLSFEGLDPPNMNVQQLQVRRHCWSGICVQQQDFAVCTASAFWQMYAAVVTPQVTRWCCISLTLSACLSGKPASLTAQPALRSVHTACHKCTLLRW